MPSRIDPTRPEERVPASKADMRANWAAAKAEIEHGGFFTAPGTGAIDRTTASALAETVRASDFGALGDGSATTVDQWLSGGTYSRGAADLAELRAKAGIADLVLNDTIDWAAITAALAAAGNQPVRLKGGASYRTSRPIVLTQGGLDGSGSGVAPAIAPVTHGAHDVVQLRPAASNRIIVLRRFHANGGARGIHADSSAGGGYFHRMSVWEDVFCDGNAREGFFFEGIQAIGHLFRNIHAENNGAAGIRFTGRAMLNASQLLQCRAVDNRGAGFLLENTNDQEDTSAVAIVSAIAEYNDGPGMKIVGWHVALVAPHFENNDNDISGGEPDILLDSSGTAGGSRVHSFVTCVAPYFSSAANPDRIRVAAVSGAPWQSMTLIAPKMNWADVIDATAIELTILGIARDKVKVTGGYPATFSAGGYGVMGGKTVLSGATSLGVPASLLGGGVIKVLASKHSDFGGPGFAEYALQLTTNDTITSTFLHGEDILTFGVDVNGNITAACTTGGAIVSVYGH